MQVGAAKPATITTNTPIISQYTGRDPITPAIYTPADIGAIHKAPENSLIESITKAPPRILNTGMQWLSRLGRFGTACIAGVGAVFTVLSLFLFNAKIAILCALPTLAALAAYIGLKPKEELHSTLQTANHKLLEKIGSDAEDATPNYILSRADEVIKALQNARNNWGSLVLEKRPALLKTIENLKGKILPIYDVYKDLAARGKDGLAQMFPGCSMAKLEEMMQLLNDCSTDLGAHLVRKSTKLSELGNN